MQNEELQRVSGELDTERALLRTVLEQVELGTKQGYSYLLKFKLILLTQAPLALTTAHLEDLPE